MQFESRQHSPLVKTHGILRCLSAGCNGEVRFFFQKCSHTVCACCIKSSEGYVDDGDGSKKAVLACPECVRHFRQYSNWTTPQNLINTLAEVFYCMQCWKQEAHYRGQCGHLLCLQCLRKLDLKSNQRACGVLGCTTVIDMTDVFASFKDIQAVEIWKSLEVPKIQQCRFPCKQKAVVALKPCGHVFCYSCIQMKLKNNIETRQALSGMRVFRCTLNICQTTIKERTLDHYLTNISCSVLLATLTLEISTKECYKCKDDNKYEPRVRNTSCASHHTFCLSCLSNDRKTIGRKPFLHGNNIMLQRPCLFPQCEITTPVVTLEDFIDTLTGKSSKVEIFLRRADISELCFCKKYASVTRMACSHGLCVDCIDEILSTDTVQYNKCRGNFDKCNNLIPISIFRAFLHEKNAKVGLGIPKEKHEQKRKESAKAKLILAVNESNGSLTLSAELSTSLPIKTISWIHNGIEVQTAENPIKFFEDLSTPSHPFLVIRDLQNMDVGSYALKAETEDKIWISDEVRFSLPIDSTKISVFQAPDREDGSIVLQANILTKWPVKRTRWQKDGVDLFFSNIALKYTENKSDKHNPSLTILHFDKTDEGKYSLISESLEGIVKSEYIEIKAPKVTQQFKMEMTLNKNRSIKFIGNPSSAERIETIRWLKDDKEIDLKNIRKYYAGRMHNMPTLVVFDIKEDDQGCYQAVVKSNFGILLSEPALFRIPKDAIRVSLKSKFEGKSLILRADILISEWPLIRYVWHKNEKEFYPLKNCREDSSYFLHPKLIFSNFSERDYGLYSISAETLGGVSSSASLNVLLVNQPAKPSTAEKEYKPENYSDMQVHRELNTHHRNPESKISMVPFPYKGFKRCKLCHELAVVEIEKCHDSFCLHCMAVLTAQLPDDHKYFSCIDGCNSWISLEALEAFYKRPCAKQLEAPIYFQIKTDVCGNCKGDGIIKARLCNHTLCLDCLQKSKPDEKCQTPNCSSRKLPPKYYFEILISSLCSEKLEKKLPFLIYLDESEGLFSNENWKCSAYGCMEKAFVKVVRCGHNMCSKCVQSAKKEQIKGYLFCIATCSGSYLCTEQFPLLLCCPERKKSDASEVSRKDNTATKNTEISDSNGKRKLDKDNAILDGRQSQEKIARKPGSRGLRNIGFSCYRNSILQILAETPHFLEVLEKSTPEKRMEWIVLLKIILEGIRNNTTEDIDEQLYAFHHEFNKLNPEYREYEQEDCLSFLTSLLNGIQDAFKEHRGTMTEPVHIFRGKWRDKYGCQNCSNVEYFNDSDFFYLPLPYSEKRNKEATIGSCFLGLLKEEDIDIFPCSECGSQKMTKQLEIVEFPTILVLQISKIHEVDLFQHECSFEKRRNYVRFWDNFEGLTNVELKRKIGDDTLRPYRLFGVVVHWGSEKSGHYICYVKIKGELKWKRCDDSYVDDISVKNVLKSNAYLLFYEKCESAIN